MSDLIQEVTPLTRGIIWLLKDEPGTDNSYYRDVDYLLDGLLTSNLEVTKNVSSRVIVGSNFNESLYVMVVYQLKDKELNSYLSLLKDLSSENDILVIDEANKYEDLRKSVGKLSSHFRLIK